MDKVYRNKIIKLARHLYNRYAHYTDGTYKPFDQLTYNGQKIWIGNAEYMMDKCDLVFKTDIK